MKEDTKMQVNLGSDESLYAKKQNSDEIIVQTASVNIEAVNLECGSQNPISNYQTDGLIETAISLDDIGDVVIDENELGSVEISSSLNR